MEEDLRTLILTGTGAPSLVFFAARAQGSGLPAVVLNRITGIPSMTMDGPDGLVFSRMQVDVYDSTWLGAKTALRVIQSTVSGYAGTVGDTEFQLIQIDGERDFREAGQNDADRFFRVSMDLVIHHRSA